LPVDGRSVSLQREPAGLDHNLSVRFSGRRRGFRLVAKGLVFALCCAADAFVLRTTWTGRQVAEGQFRRGYFERFGNEVGLSIDADIRYPMVPWFLLTGDALAVPPGMTAVAPLVPGAEYDLTCDSALAPYVVIGAEAPVAPVASHLSLRPGEARLAGGRTLSLRDGRLAIVAWDPTRPWREDAARLSALRDGCGARHATAALAVKATDRRLEVHLGSCSLTESLASSAGAAPLLAALAGPDWLTVTRQPGWIGERWVVWQVLAVVVVRVATTWWSAGPASAAAVSALLGWAAFRMPVAAVLTYPLALIIGVVAAILRMTIIAFRRLPRRSRPLAALAVVAAGCAITFKARQPDSPAPIIPAHAADGRRDACAVVGYSAAGGASLRGSTLRHNGLNALLNEDCAPCRDTTAELTGGGETLGWLQNAYCTSVPSFGAGGQVIFLGGANDDFEWGMLSVPRLFIVAEQGIEPWRRNQAPAAAASLARIDAQASALDGLLQCIHSRGARFVFLHDFLVSDMVAGREPDRAAMLARRRAVVEKGGGTFVDLLDVFGDEAGISWFNDYVHPSLVAHERFADLACRQFR
jgi:hypothetical protein